MTERDPALAPFEALIGTWTTRATHPLFDAVVPGSVTFEWFEGGHFLVQRFHNDHESFPDAIGVIGVPERGDGLVMEYFDSRGVRPTYGVSLDDGVLRLWRDDPTLRVAPRVPRRRARRQGRKQRGRSSISSAGLDERGTVDS
jgi:hypothetical protein